MTRVLEWHTVIRLNLVLSCPLRPGDTCIGDRTTAQSMPGQWCFIYPSLPSSRYYYCTAVEQFRTCVSFFSVHANEYLSPPKSNFFLTHWTQAPTSNDPKKMWDSLEFKHRRRFTGRQT